MGEYSDFVYQYLATTQHQLIGERRVNLLTAILTSFFPAYADICGHPHNNATLDIPGVNLIKLHRLTTNVVPEPIPDCLSMNIIEAPLPYYSTNFVLRNIYTISFLCALTLTLTLYLCR